MKVRDSANDTGGHRLLSAPSLMATHASSIGYVLQASFLRSDPPCHNREGI